MAKRTSRKRDAGAQDEPEAAKAPGKAPDGERPPPPTIPRTDPALEATDFFDRLVLAYSYLRWIVQTGSEPTPADWSTEDAYEAGWPAADSIERYYEGGWEELARESGARGGALEAELARMEEAVRRAEAAEKSAARDKRRVQEIERRSEQATDKRREAEDARDAEARERAALAEEVERLRAKVAELEEAAARAAPEPPEDAEEPAPGEPSREWIAEHERVVGRLRAAEHAAHEAEDRAQRAEETVRDLESEAARLRRELAMQLGRRREGRQEEDVQDPVPGSVLEAVEIAAAQSEHLQFAPGAFESAQDSPFTDAEQVLDVLRRLDRVAGRYAQGSMGKGLRDAAVEEGILDWAGGISETTRTRWADHYTFRHHGHELMMDAHVGLGAGKGAGQVARIYLHIADGRDEDLGRGIIVAHVGRHLPDTTTG